MKDSALYAWILLLLVIAVTFATQQNTQHPQDSDALSSAHLGSNASVRLDGNEIQASDNGEPDELFLNPDGGGVRMGPNAVKAPLAYGRVGSDGSPISFSSNITATHRHGHGAYDIHIAGNALSTDVILVTPNGLNAVVNVFIQDGAYHIDTFWQYDGDRADVGFSFIIYRP